jgi:uncharacterized protein
MCYGQDHRCHFNICCPYFINVRPMKTFDLRFTPGVLNVAFVLLLLVACTSEKNSSGSEPDFRVIGFYTAQNDVAHITFVHEANRWFSEMGNKYKFTYDSTNNWNNLNRDFLSAYDVVLFLDTRPDSADQRQAFEQYVKGGGAWMGFHFAGFALTPSDFPQNWDWYHNEFLGVGQFKSNTWRPTSAVLRIEDRTNPVMLNLPDTFRSAPSEWYRWENDLRSNGDIKVLASIDPASFPLGTGPKPDEIWHEGDYPVIWTNKKYRMLYLNMGHNDIDYEGGTNKQLLPEHGP